MITSIHLDIPLSEYEEMTPYELNCYIEVYQSRMKAEREEKLTTIWLGEYYHRLKKLPSLKSELEALTKQENKQMSDEEMLVQVKKLNAMFGGKVKS